MYQSPMAAAIYQRREQDHPFLDAAPFELKQWLVNPKTPKLFEHFNGEADSYSIWASRVKDHLLSNNLGWDGVGR